MELILEKDLIGEVETIFEELSAELKPKYSNNKDRGSSRKGYREILRESGQKSKRSVSKGRPNLFNDSVKNMHQKYISGPQPTGPDGDAAVMERIELEREYITPRYRDLLRKCLVTES